MSTTWTPRSRTLAALACEQPDRVPIQPLLFGKTDPSYRPLIDYVNQHGDVVVQWPVPPVPNPADDGKLTETVLPTPKGDLKMARQLSVEHGTAWTREYLIENQDDAEKWLSRSLQAPPAQPDVSSLRTLREQWGEAAVIRMGFGSAFAAVQSLVPMETFYTWCFTERRLIERLVARAHEENLARQEALLAAFEAGGARPDFMWHNGMEMCVSPYLPPSYFRDFIVRYDGEVLRRFREAGLPVMIHCHGRLRDVIDMILGMEPAALHPFEAPPLGDMTAAESKAAVRGAVCIVGNIQLHDVYRSTPTQIRDMTRRLIDDAAEGGGLIATTTAQFNARQIEPQHVANYVAFVETVLEYGRY